MVNRQSTKENDKMQLYCSATKLLEVSSTGFMAEPMSHVFPPFNVPIVSIDDIWTKAKEYHAQAVKNGAPAAVCFYVRQARGERAFRGMDKSIALLNRELRFANPELVRVSD